MLFVSVFLQAAAFTELTVWNMPTGADIQYRELWDESVKDFQVRNPRIRIKGISREFTPQEFVSVMASGKGPDIARIPVTAIPAMARYGFLAELTPYTEMWMQKDFMPRIMWDSVNVEGKIFGIPYDSYFTALFYRKDIFEKCGLNDYPRTWNDILEYSKIINSRMKGVWGIALQPDLFYFIDFIWQAGGGIYENDRINLNTPAVLKALNFWLSLKNQGALPPQAITYESDVEQLFATGKTAMMIGVAKRLPVMKRRYGLDMSAVEIVPLPAGNDGIQAWHAGGEAFIINSGLPNQERKRAWRFIEHVSSPAHQLWLWVTMKRKEMIIFPGDFSPATNLINMPEFAKVKGLFEYAHTEPLAAGWPMIKEDFNRYVLERVFAEKDPDISGILSDFDEKMKEGKHGR